MLSLTADNTRSVFSFKIKTLKLMVAVSLSFE